MLDYDAWIPNLERWNLITQGLPDRITNPQEQAARESGTIQSVCGAAQQRCTGNNTQYSSVEDCVSVLSSKDFGDYDETWDDNVVCRSIHVLLTLLRPDVRFAILLHPKLAQL